LKPDTKIFNPLLGWNSACHNWVWWLCSYAKSILFNTCCKCKQFCIYSHFPSWHLASCNMLKKPKNRINEVIHFNRNLAQWMIIFIQQKSGKKNSFLQTWTF